MKAYHIYNTISGTDLGVFWGYNEDDALNAMARKAGYPDHKTACEVAPVKDNELLVKEVESNEWVKTHTIKIKYHNGTTEYIEVMADIIIDFNIDLEFGGTTSLYTEDEWNNEEGADWSYESGEGLFFQGSQTYYPFTAAEVTISQTL